MSPEREQAFKDFLVRESVHVDLMTAGINLLLGAALAFLLGRLYIRYGRSASDRRAFAGHFILITVTTSLIIVVVKSSRLENSTKKLASMTSSVTSQRFSFTLVQQSARTPAIVASG